MYRTIHTCLRSNLVTPACTLSFVSLPRAGATGRISVTFRAALGYMPPLQRDQVSVGQAAPLPEVQRHGAGECRLVVIVSREACVAFKQPTVS